MKIQHKILISKIKLYIMENRIYRFINIWIIGLSYFFYLLIKYKFDTDKVHLHFNQIVKDAEYRLKKANETLVKNNQELNQQIDEYKQVCKRLEKMKEEFLKNAKSS